MTRPQVLLALVLCTLAAAAAPARAQSFRFDKPSEAPTQTPTDAPLSLTASDGTGLALVRLKARAVVEGPLAFTELRLAFKNPQARTIEGRFRITLPEGAALSRFAMKLGDRWQEGEVVEKEAARRAYEDFLHRRQDPALLEQAAGNEFTARVFPIPGKGTKELIISYSHALTTDGGTYKLPLRGLPEVQHLDVRVAGQPKTALVRSGWVPDRDFVVGARRGRPTSLRNGAFIVTEVTPVTSTGEDRVPSLTVLLDTSASRALGLVHNVRLVEGLAKALARGQGKNTKLRVAVFDQSVESVYDGTAGAYGRDVSRRILRRRALGASNLDKALQWAAKNARTERLVLVTDGVATAGGLDVSELDTALTSLSNSGVGRIDAIATGGLRNSELLRAVVTGHARRDGAVIDGDAPLRDVAQRLVRATASGLRVDVPGAAWVWPEMIDGAQAGDPVLLYIALPKGKPLRVKVGGRGMKVAKPADANRHLLARAAAQAEIARLVQHRSTSTAKQEKARLKQQIVALSVESRVMSPFTSLLVLETEADYARYGIARRGLADILVVNKRGLVAQKRSLKDVPKPVVKKPKPRPKLAKSKAKKSGRRSNRAREGEAEAPGNFEGMKEVAAEGEGEPDGDASADKMDAAPEPEPMAEAEAEPERKVARSEAPAESAAPSRRVRSRSRPRPAPRAPPPASAAPAGELLADEREAAEDDDEEGDSAPHAIEADPYDGPFREVMQLIERRKAPKALQRATAWRDEAPGDVMALVALGEAFTANSRYADAARAYGSLIDLFPGRADLRRFAGQRLEALAKHLSTALDLATDTYSRAREQRPDHPASHHLLAFALVKSGEYERAFTVLEEALKRRYPDGRFAGVREILAEDLGLVAAAWSKVAKSQRRAIANRRGAAGGREENRPSVRFVLNWETDANDVDFHIYDGKGGHAFYSSPRLRSGGRLYADVTTGYGPECFTIRKGKKARAGPYTLQAHYYSRGPMGYGMGKLQVIEHDGKGRLTFDERPFVVMKDGAYLDLGKVR